MPLGMPNEERRRLMDVLLRLQKLAGDAFDVLDAQMISERDALLFLQLPDYCNAFTLGIEKFARSKVGRGGDSVKGESDG